MTFECGCLHNCRSVLSIEPALLEDAEHGLNFTVTHPARNRSIMVIVDSVALANLRDFINKYLETKKLKS